MIVQVEHPDRFALSLGKTSDERCEFVGAERSDLEDVKLPLKLGGVFVELLTDKQQRNVAGCCGFVLLLRPASGFRAGSIALLCIVHFAVRIPQVAFSHAHIGINIGTATLDMPPPSPNYHLEDLHAELSG